MEARKIVSLGKLIENQKLQESLQQEFTNTKLYEGDYGRFQKYCAEIGEPVSSEMLVYYLNHSLKEDGVKKNTFNKRYFSCKKLLELAGIEVELEHIEMIKQLRKHYRSDEFAKKARTEGKRAVPSTELLDFIASQDDVRTKAILYVQFYTGCRPSEMVLLKVEDFHLDDGYVNVYLKKQKEYKEKRLKSDCIEAVQAYIEKYDLQGENNFLGHGDRHGNYVDKPMTLSGYSKFLQRKLELSAYSFRKSLVQHMYKNGADVETIRKQTGHASSRTIVEHYLNVDTTMVDDYL